MNNKIYWVYRQHDLNAELCDLKGVDQNEFYSAFVRLFNKLLLNYKMILIPLQRSLQELKMKKYSGSLNITEIHRSIIQLREQSHVISNLRTKGFLTEAKYQEQTSEIRRKIAKNQKDLKLLTHSDDDSETLLFSEDDKDKIRNNTFSIDKPGVVSFELQEASNQSNGQRYKVNLRDYIWYDNIWMNKGNGYACYPTIPINGIRSKIAFFENAFDEPDDFSPRIQYVSFEVIPYKDMYKAVNIHDESKGAYIRRKVYFARHIRNGNSPSQFLYNGRFHFLMITLFTGKKYISDVDCPIELKEAFNSSKNKWLKMFLNCDDDWKKMRIFNLLSLVSTDLGENYYIIAHKYLEAYLNGYGKLPDYIGYSLDDCTTDHQKTLLSDICSLKKEKAVCILSKGVWGNEDLIKNIPVSLTLEYFEAAINYLGQLINEVKKDKKKAKDITMCLEFVLCVFRLRSYKDEELNKLLSLNNKYVKKLYKYVETLIENKIEIHSFLSLEIKNKGVYEDVPNILYALLLFITGAEGAGDIKIAGLSLDDLTT